MNSTRQTNKFARLLKNNAALLLIIFCVIAIATVVLAVTLAPGNDTPNPDIDVTVDPDDNVNNPDDNKPELIKVYFQSPVDYTVVTMEYTDGEELLFVINNTINTWATHNAVDPASYTTLTQPTILRFY